MTTLADEFSEVFRCEHRLVRDLLLDLVDAFTSRDGARARALLEETTAATGPHFRYEEEALYPLLTPVFGEPYIEHLHEEHDGAIARVRALVQLAERDSPTDRDATEAVQLVREVLPHVSDCEGLSVMVEVLPEEEVQDVFTARARSQEAGLGLFEWADTIRGR